MNQAQVETAKARQAEIAKAHLENRCANVTSRFPNGKARSCTCADEYRNAAPKDA